ncbi:hypothetical protein B0J14DRAFT_585006 [Halenospora varia]|nr:hypothetical protein B0J14DRAFT_585006 [Halenospora varia]
MDESGTSDSNHNIVNNPPTPPSPPRRRDRVSICIWGYGWILKSVGGLFAMYMVLYGAIYFIQVLDQPDNSRSNLWRLGSASTHIIWRTRPGAFTKWTTRTCPFVPLQIPGYEICPWSPEKDDDRPGLGPERKLKPEPTTISDQNNERYWEFVAADIIRVYIPELKSMLADDKELFINERTAWEGVRTRVHSFLRRRRGLSRPEHVDQETWEEEERNLEMLKRAAEHMTDYIRKMIDNLSDMHAVYIKFETRFVSVLGLTSRLPNLGQPSSDENGLNSARSTPKPINLSHEEKEVIKNEYKRHAFRLIQSLVVLMEKGDDCQSRWLDLEMLNVESIANVLYRLHEREVSYNISPEETETAWRWFWAKIGFYSKSKKERVERKQLQEAQAIKNDIIEHAYNLSSNLKPAAQEWLGHFRQQHASFEKFEERISEFVEDSPKFRGKDGRQAAFQRFWERWIADKDDENTQGEINAGAEWQALMNFRNELMYSFLKSTQLQMAARKNFKDLVTNSMAYQGRVKPLRGDKGA